MMIIIFFFFLEGYSRLPVDLAFEKISEDEGLGDGGR